METSWFMKSSRGWILGKLLTTIPAVSVTPKQVILRRGPEAAANHMSIICPSICSQLPTDTLTLLPSTCPVSNFNWQAVTQYRKVILGNGAPDFPAMQRMEKAVWMILN